MKGATVVVEIHNPHTKVSIHAPMKGATNNGQRRNFFRLVSIHAPMKGATEGLWPVV